MSEELLSPFDNLPVELIYQILHLIDSTTILLSFRYVSKRFYHLTNVYNRYRLNFRQCSKANFYRFCKIIRPSLVEQLILSDDHQTPGQIALFVKNFHLNQFHCLRSLSLLDIGDSNLNVILEKVSLDFLQSLTIQSRTFYTWTPSTLSALTTMLEQSSLKTLNFSIWCFEIYDFIWPNRCFIEYLNISSRISFDQYCTILDRCSLLKTILIKDVLWNDPKLPVENQYSQLKSLTISDNRMDISRLESFLSLTPTLNYLKLIGMAYLDESNFWENLFRTKLIHIERFDFFFLSWKNVDYDLRDIESLIRPYKTPFWLETKKWKVNCDCILHPAELMLYSVPICKTEISYYQNSNKISCSNTNEENFVEQFMSTENITTLRINLMRIVNEDDQTNLKNQSIDPIFPLVRHLIVDLDGRCSSTVCSSLSKLICLPSLTDFQLNLNYDLGEDLNSRTNLIELFQQTTNLQHFDICNNLPLMLSNTTMDDILSIVPRSIRHFKINVKNLNDMKTIFDHFQHLSSINFEFSCLKSMPSTKLIESLLKIRTDLTYRKDDTSIQVWLNS